MAEENSVSERKVSLSFGSTGGIAALLILILMKMCDITERLDVIIEQTRTDRSAITAMRSHVQALKEAIKQDEVIGAVMGKESQP